MAKKKIKTVSLEEQETTINVDYFSKTISAFTSKKSVYDKWCKDLGEPIEIATEKGRIVGGTWRIPAEDRNITKKIFSISTVVPKK